MHPRIVGHMVTRNELGRYLKDTVRWLMDLTDGLVFIYDDQSNDGTYEYLRDVGVTVVARKPEMTSFAENESAFRENGWLAMGANHTFHDGDWILCMDADEFLVSSSRGTDSKEALIADVVDAERFGVGGFRHHVIEVFDIIDGVPHQRVDGYWGAISACRLVRWQPTNFFRLTPQGGGSVPVKLSYATNYSERSAILHYGYASHRDRLAKYDRYSQTLFHASTHIRSIREIPTLVPWSGTVPVLEYPDAR